MEGSKKGAAANNGSIRKTENETQRKRGHVRLVLFATPIKRTR